MPLMAGAGAGAGAAAAGRGVAGVVRLGADVIAGVTRASCLWWSHPPDADHTPWHTC